MFDPLLHLDLHALHAAELRQEADRARLARAVRTTGGASRRLPALRALRTRAALLH